jgi:hypothetical protein
MKAEGVDGLYLSILERCFGQSPGPLFQATVGAVLFSKVAAKFTPSQDELDAKLKWKTF